MPTYTKETALYDTGAIKNGIDGAAGTATSYLTNVSGGGVMVHPSDDSTSGWKIASALELIKSGVTYIKAWLAGTNSDIPTVQIGVDNGGHSFIDSNGMRIYGGSDGTTQLANIGYGEGTAQIGTDIAPYYTLGLRSPIDQRGNYSFAEGYITKSQGFASHAEGGWTNANGQCSHAEGDLSKALGGYSHAEGYFTEASGAASHAEGARSVASEDYSHAEGYESVASGRYSHAAGKNTEASRQSQTVIGEFNIIESGSSLHKGDSVFIIGNGTADDARSNALTVDWDGNVEAQGTISDGGGQLGERILTDDAAASRATGRYFNVASVTLPKGMWIVTCACSFADGTNATGIRRSYITTDAPSGWNNTTTGPASTAIVFYDQVSPLSGNYNSYTRGMGTASITTDTPVTYYLVAYHTAGSAINVTGRINAIRVGTDV